MTRIVLNDGTEEYCSPGEARKKVAAGEAKLDQFVPTYSTRQMVAETPKADKKVKRKRRTKAEIEADKAAAEANAHEAE